MGTLMTSSIFTALKVAVITAIFFLSLQTKATLANDTLFTVYKDPQCGCCQGWIDHANQSGLVTKTVHPDNLYSMKKQLGIAPNLQSCHTAITPRTKLSGGFIFEWHVPVKYIKQFIAKTPSGAFGLSVPGMVVGSPGMENGNKFRAYKIIQLNRDGSHVVYAEIKSYQQQF